MPVSISWPPKRNLLNSDKKICPLNVCDFTQAHKIQSKLPGIYGDLRYNENIPSSSS